MPTFELVSIGEVMTKFATGRRAQTLKEYLGYIEQLKAGQAGRLQASEGESVAAVRRRLGAAAKTAGKDLLIRRDGDEVYFWMRTPGQAARRQRGRPRGATARGR